MVNSCTVCLNNSRIRPDLSFFTYPKDRARRQEWLKAIDRYDLMEKLDDERKRPTQRICEEHFEPHCFMFSKNGNVKYLSVYAFPTLKLPTDGGAGGSEHQGPIIQNVISIAHVTHRSVQTDIESSNHKFLKLSDIFMSKSIAQLIKWQIDLKAEGRGNQHSDAYRFFALRLHYSGPATYRFLKNSLCLPSLASLQNLVTPLGTNIDKRILTALKIKVDRMVPQEKICSVHVGSISLKENIFYNIRNDKIIGFHEINGKQKPLIAKYAIVIMIRGIIYEWKQPVVYSFFARCENHADVSFWIDEIISSLLNVGLDIRAFVSDLGTDFISEPKSCAVNVDQTYFEVNGRRIYCIFDIPRLMKYVSNSLQISNFIYDENKVAKWSDIRAMYNKDKNNEHKLAPKLTDIHIYCTKMRVKSAVQVLSHTVSAAINTYIDLKLIDASARDTAEFIDKINNLFDMLNSSTLQSPNKFKRAYCGDDFQIKFLQNMLEFFKDLKLENLNTKANITQSMHFIRGFQISIKSIIKLYEDLQSTGVQFIETRRLNLDVVENFFAKVRRTAGACHEPTCRQFAKAFKKKFVCSILRTQDDKNTQEDLDSLIMKHEDNQRFQKTIQDPEVTIEITSIAVGTSDYRFKLPIENALAYVSGYLYTKCIELHKCEKILSYINSSEQPMDISNDAIFSHNKDIDGNVNSGFLKPPDDFVAFIGVLDTNICSYFYLEQQRPYIGNEMIMLLEHCTFEMPCDCFPIDYLKNLFVRLKIYHAVKQNNGYLKNKKIRQTVVFKISPL